MKKLITILLITFTGMAHATNYYVAASGDDTNNGTSTSTPWKTCAKVNAMFSGMAAGDGIYFNGGEYFTGPLIVGKSGTSGNNIIISSYGTGKAIITGFTAVNSWVSLGNNNYQSVATIAAKASVNLVTIDGIPQGVARSPNRNAANGGYLVYSTFGGSTAKAGTGNITSTTAPALTYTDSEIVIRKQRWDLERDTVTGQSANVISYRQPYSGNIYTGKANYGYFHQRQFRLLDQFGEWMFKGGKLYQNFAGSNPAAYTVKISTVDTLLDINNKNYITVSNLQFEGANYAAIFAYASSTGNISITNCDVLNSGREGITIKQTQGVYISNCTTNYCLGSGIFIKNNGSQARDNSTVQYCTVTNTCQIPGMEISGDAPGRCGITVVGGNNVTIQYNTVDSAGYAPIEWLGSNVWVYGNIVSNSLNVRDDGGMIYDYVGNGATPTQYSNCIIRKNIIINAIGAPLGTSVSTSSGRGIYCDEGSNHILVDSNTITGCTGPGLYGNSMTDITYRANIVYNNAKGWQWNRFENAPATRNMKLVQNQLFPYTGEYNNNQIDVPSLITIDQDIQAVGLLDSTLYQLKTTIPLTLSTQTTGKLNYKTYTKTFSYLTGLGQELNAVSKASTSDSVRLVMNTSLTTQVQALGAKYVGIANNVQYNGSIILPPLGTMLLRYVGATTVEEQQFLILRGIKF